MLLFSEKKKINCVGMMSGTSCDGLDLALVEIDRDTSEHQIIDCKYIAYPKSLRTDLLELIANLASPFERLKQIETDLSIWYADQLKQFHSTKTDLVGMHGQTIFYRSPESNQMGLSWQLGSVTHVAKLSGLICVGDFRNGDIAHMGQGAPLVPYYDYIEYNDAKENQLLLNLGGISNGTYLKKACQQQDVIAFDFGPANCLIDLAMQNLFDLDFDQNGQTALTGNVHEELVKSWVKSEPYFTKKPPKATGREYFNQAYVDRLIHECKANELNNPSIIATITAFTVDQIIFQLTHFSLKTDELIITGGGFHNQAIMERFRQNGFMIKKIVSQEADFKEAILFARLAFNYIKQETSNLKTVTGAYKETILGVLALP